MKILLSLLFILLLSFGNVFAADKTVPELMSYEGYLKNMNTYCKLEGNIPNKAQLWKDWEQESLVKKAQVVYADIQKKEDGDRVYKEYLKNIKADPSRIDIL